MRRSCAGLPPYCTGLYSLAINSSISPNRYPHSSNSAMRWECSAAVVFLLSCSAVFSLDYCGVPVRRIRPLRRNDAKLQQVVVVIRHGDRTVAWPKPCWPNANDTTEWDCNLSSGSIPVGNRDSHQVVVDRIYRKVYMKGKQLQKGDCGVGQLTAKGFAQELANGEALRKAYVNTGFLSKKFSAGEVFLRSDDMPRTIQSAQSVALGLYPAIPSPNSSLVEVMDIHTRDMVVDDMEPNSIVCPKYEKLSSECLKNETFIKHFNEVTKPLLRDLEKALDQPGMTVEDVVRLMDCMLVRKCHNKPLPPKLDDSLFQRTFAEGFWLIKFRYSCPSQAAISKVGIGFLINDIWKILTDSMQEKTSRKFTLISGHDTTLTALLSALNGTLGAWPRYASMMQFELYSTAKVNAGFAIRMVYNGKEVKLPFCDDVFCDVTQFSKYISTVTPQDPVADCKVDSSDDKKI